MIPAQEGISLAQRGARVTVTVFIVFFFGSFGTMQKTSPASNGSFASAPPA